jgi:hypothetical protein
MSSLKSMLVLVSLMWAVSVTAETNLCFNGNFDSPEGALDGWNVNYEWLGNSNYMQNHTHVSVVPLFEGRKNVMCTTFPVQGRVESKPILIEKGARYKCTLDLFNAGGVRFYFNCYKWEPGIAPHSDPKLSELRRIYKSEPFTGGSGGGWKTISFYLPMEEISELAYSNYKDVRFATIYMTRYRGGFNVANVRVVKLPGTYKVRPSPAMKPTTGGNTLPKLPPPKGLTKPAAGDDFSE